MGNYVMDPISSFTDRRGPITALAAYDDATSWVIDIRGQNDKVVIVKNTGAGALTYNILGSIDSPDMGLKDQAPFVQEWDLIHLGDTVVAPAGVSIQKFSDYYTYLKVQVKGVGGIATIKVAATGN
jgi:hypothetical protein